MLKNNLLKPCVLASLLFLLIANAYSQKITSNPKVDNDYSDESSVMTITSVATGLGEKNVTVVTFRYVTSLFKPWIALDSRTALTTNKAQTKYQILDWGIVLGDEDVEFSSLKFDNQYSIKRRIAYNLYMVFPAIPNNATILNIQEPGQNGFFWRGIHINNTTTEDLSKGSPQYAQKGEFRASGSGSGFAISGDGYVATCYHVVENAKAIRIRGVGGNFETPLSAKVAYTDREHDLAILKVDNARISTLPYSFATTLSDVGEDIFVLGYPQTQHLGEELKLTTGVISSRSGYRGDATTYQISAQALPGNSGCPLFDGNGKVIGVVSAKYIEPNVSYAVKLSFLKTLIENSNIRLAQPVSNAITGKTLAEKVKSVRNFVYIIEVEQ